MCAATTSVTTNRKVTSPSFMSVSKVVSDGVDSSLHDGRDAQAGGGHLVRPTRHRVLLTTVAARSLLQRLCPPSPLIALA